MDGRTKVIPAPTVTVLSKAGVAYPSGEYCFSPDERYPEYPFSHISPKPNAIYRMVRTVLRDAGLDMARYGTPQWNPLGEWIRRGQKVFCLVNFVTSRRPWQRQADVCGMLTHGSVIRPILDYLLIATGRPDLVSFGNAPVQGAHLPTIMLDTGAGAIQNFYIQQTGCDPGPRDLRLYISNVSVFGYMRNSASSDMDDDVTFDLGRASLLDGLPDGAFSRFRIADYGASANQLFHDRSRHLYRVHKAAIEADVLFHIPKLKVHGKVGLTCALKGAVGAISRKECLAHHQTGSPSEGGDEFPKTTLLTRAYRALGERRLDKISMFQNGIRTAHTNLGRILDHLFKMDIKGHWYGNNTAWRMALDINQCLLYGKPDGSLSKKPTRKMVSLVDGIIGGEGNGPIHVTGRPAGVLLLSEDICAGDAVAALTISFDPNRIPLIRESFCLSPRPLTQTKLDNLNVRVNGALVHSSELADVLDLRFQPPRGWRGKIELLDSVLKQETPA